MNEQSQAKSPDTLRAMVAGTLANFQHPTLKHNLTTLKALHHVAWMDDTLHVELVMPFVWNSAFEVLKEAMQRRSVTYYGRKSDRLETVVQHCDAETRQKSAWH